MLTQIYEISAPEEALAISQIGIEHIGILVGNGEFPREQSLEASAEITGAVRPPSKVSALFLTSDISLIQDWARRLRPPIVHLGAAPELLSSKDAASLKRKLPGVLLMRSIPVVDEASIQIAQCYDGIADFLL